MFFRIAGEPDVADRAVQRHGLFRRQRAGRSEWVDAGEEERFRRVNVPDTGDLPLV